MRVQCLASYFHCVYLKTIFSCLYELRERSKLFLVVNNSSFAFTEPLKFYQYCKTVYIQITRIHDMISPCLEMNLDEECSLNRCSHLNSGRLAIIDLPYFSKQSKKKKMTQRNRVPLRVELRLDRVLTCGFLIPETQDILQSRVWNRKCCHATGTSVGSGYEETPGILANILEVLSFNRDFPFLGTVSRLSSG